MIFEVKNRWTKGLTLKFELRLRDDFAAFYQVILNRSYEFLNLKEGDIVLDAGAHIGVFTVLASKIVGDKGAVVSVEPHPLNFRRLLTNIRLNDCNNVIPVNKALAAKSGMELYISGYGGTAHVGDQGLAVKSISLKDLQNELGLKFTKIKMDIEGSEGEVLLSSSDSLQEVTHIVVEVHDQRNFIYTLEALKRFYLLKAPIESLRRVIIEILKDPLMTVRLETSNRFRTTLRILKDLLRVNRIDKENFPILLLGIKSPTLLASEER